jgi:hypothetical protein
MNRLLAAALCCVLNGAMAASETAPGAALTGTRSIVLGNAEGERVAIGQVIFTPEAGGKSRFRVVLDAKLEEYFLAMRPFRCLTGTRQRLCNFPVAREEPLVDEADLLPLEYALMFIRTEPAALHINPFNGVYYRMKVVGARIEGVVHDVDMEPFIVPDSVPVERRKRPLSDGDLSIGDARTHWLPSITIE